MKQKYHGEKVQNWHRPFRSWQLSEKYLRQKYVDPEFSNNGEQINKAISGDWLVEPDEDIDWLRTCGDFDCSRYCYCEKQFAWDEDIYWFKLGSWLDQVSPAENNPFYQAFEKKGITVKRLPEPVYYDEDSEELSNVNEQIAAFMSLSLREAQDLAQPLLVCNASIEIIKEALPENVFGRLAVLACFYASFWIRSPLDWKKENGSILSHLFVKYTSLDFLLYDYKLDRTTDSKWFIWYIIIGQGGSLHKSSNYFSWEVSKSFQRELLTCTSVNFGPIHGCFLAFVLMNGGDRKLFNHLIDNRGYLFDPTAITEEYQRQHLLFVQETIRWFSKPWAIEDEQVIENILRWALHMDVESRRLRQEPFSWKGRSSENVTDLANKYVEELSKPWKEMSWASHSWDWTFHENDEMEWHFKELCTGYELYKEGQKMRHCVSSYTYHCANGSCAIVSLKQNGISMVTIEVDPWRQLLKQCRGACNRLVTQQERLVIEQWFLQKVKNENTSSH